MINIQYFLAKITNLDDSIKDSIKEIINTKFQVHIEKTKNFAGEINELLIDIERNIPKTLGNSIPYILGELTDNIEQHSNYSNAYIFLRYDIMEKIIKILIFDDGLTIPFVFEKNGIKFLNDSEAMNLALKGTTTKKEDIPRGFGLRTSKDIVKALKGSIKIISRKGMLGLQDSITEYKELNKELNGTLIIIDLKIPEKDLNIYPYLE